MPLGAATDRAGGSRYDASFRAHRRGLAGKRDEVTESILTGSP
jgi:hypothetical protein